MTRIALKRIVCAAALAFAVSAPAASAHEVAKGPNGGAVTDVSGHHVEFVSTPAALIFYLTEADEKPISVSGAKFKVIVQDGGKTVQSEVQPTEPNTLTLPLSAPLSPGAKVVLAGTLSDGHSIQARFVQP